MRRTPHYESQIVEAQDVLIQRLKALRCNGPQRDGTGALIGIQVTDEGKTGTTFLWAVGETVGAALARADARFAPGGWATKKGDGAAD